MRRLAPLVALAAALAACGGGDATPEVAELFVPLGSVQCTGGGAPLSEWERRLAAIGVQVLSASCGIDGQAHAAVCGAPDGRIAIVQVPQPQATAAATLGFTALSALPLAARSSCP